MPQTISNNQPDERTATNLRRAKQQDLLMAQKKGQSENERQRQQLSRQMEAREKTGQREKMTQEQRLRLMKEFAEFNKQNEANRPETPIEKAVREFGKAEIISEQKPGAADEESEPEEMGQVPMKPEEDFAIQPRQDENAPLEQLPQKMEAGKPAEPKTAKGGGPMPTGEEREGPLAEYGPLKAGTGTEKPEEEEQQQGRRIREPAEEETQPEAPTESEEGVPSARVQEATIKSGQMAKINELAGGAEGAAEGISEDIGKAASAAKNVQSLVKKYRFIVWIGGIIAPLIVPIIIGLIIGFTIFFVVFMIINYMDNNPGTTFFQAMYCGSVQFLGGNGFDCLFKKAIQNAPAALKAAASAKK